MFPKLFEVLERSFRIFTFHVQLEKYFFPPYYIDLYVKKPILEKQNNILLMMILEKAQF